MSKRSTPSSRREKKTKVEEVELVVGEELLKMAAAKTLDFSFLKRGEKEES